MPNKLSGSCQCGRNRFEAEGEFERFMLCHCKYCQKDTGSAHAANLLGTTATLRWLSGEDGHTAYTIPGTRHTRAFCTTCGSAVPSWQLDGTLLVVPAGSLDSGVNRTPDAHIFVASRASWDCELEKLPNHDTYPA